MIFIHIRKIYDQTEKKRNTNVIIVQLLLLNVAVNFFALHFGLRMKFNEFKEFLPNEASVRFETNAFVYPAEFAFHIFGQRSHWQIRSDAEWNDARVEQANVDKNYVLDTPSSLNKKRAYFQIGRNRRGTSWEKWVQPYSRWDFAYRTVAFEMRIKWNNIFRMCAKCTKWVSLPHWKW